MLLTYSNVKSILPFVFAFLGHSFVIPRILVLNLGNELGLHLFERKGHIHLHFSSSHDPKPLVQNQKIYSIRGNTRSDANCFQILISRNFCGLTKIIIITYFLPFVPKSWSRRQFYWRQVWFSVFCDKHWQLSVFVQLPFQDRCRKFRGDCYKMKKKM